MSVPSFCPLCVCSPWSQCVIWGKRSSCLLSGRSPRQAAVWAGGGRTSPPSGPGEKPVSLTYSVSLDTTWTWWVCVWMCVTCCLSPVTCCPNRPMSSTTCPTVPACLWEPTLWWVSECTAASPQTVAVVFSGCNRCLCLCVCVCVCADSLLLPRQCQRLPSVQSGSEHLCWTPVSHLHTHTHTHKHTHTHTHTHAHKHKMLCWPKCHLFFENENSHEIYMRKSCCITVW